MRVAMTAATSKSGAVWYRRRLLSKAQREQQARWLELLRPQDQPPAAPDGREHEENKS